MSATLMPPPEPRHRLYLLAISLMAAGGGLPFLNQALHIDDQIYVMGAEIIEQDPLRPLGPRRGFLGSDVHYYEGVNSHPAGLPYYLAAGRALTGARSEPALHALMLPFVLLLALGVWGLAAALSLHPGWSALLALSAAPVVVMSHTVMTDLPFAALFVAGLWAFVRDHGQTRASRWTALAVLLLNLAWFMQYRGLLLLPVCAGYLVIRRRLALRSLLALASVPLLLGAWCLWNRWEVGETHFFWSGGQIVYTRQRLVLSAATLAAHAGGTLWPMALPALHALRCRKGLLAALAAGSALAALGLALLLDPGVPGSRGATWVLASVGLLTLGSCGAVGWWARPHGPHLVLLFAGLVGMQCVASLFASARLLLLPLPFVALALVAGIPVQAPASRRLLAVAAGLSFALGLLVSAGDMAYAGAYRRVAPRVAWLSRQQGGRGYFVGEWGLRAYLEAAELTYLTTSDDSPRAGDHVVVPGLNCPWPLDPGLKGRLGRPVSLSVLGAFPLRTMDPVLGAGFYSDGYGPLPFNWTDSEKPYDTLLIYPVVR